LSSQITPIVISLFSTGFGGHTPLFETILERSQGDVEKCLHQSFSLEKVNFLGQNALHFAVACPQHLKSLFEAGFNVNAQDHRSSTPLIYAAIIGQTNVAMRLLAAGADVFPEKNTLSRLEVASKYGHWELVMAMLHQILSSSKYCKKSPQYFLDTALVFWAKYHEKGTKSGFLEKLLEWEADVNVRFDTHTSSSNTLLHCLTDECYVASIIGAGFNGMNLQNSRGETPLMAIANSGRPDIIKAYIANGSDIRHQDHLRWSALHLVWEKMNSFFY
jgi:ankyrin repeat protein